MLSDSQVEKFQELYKKRFGIELSRKEAYAQGSALVCFMERIYKPMTKEEFEKYDCTIDKSIN